MRTNSNIEKHYHSHAIKNRKHSKIAELYDRKMKHTASNNFYHRRMTNEKAKKKSRRTGMVGVVNEYSRSYSTTIGLVNINTLRQWSNCDYCFAKEIVITYYNAYKIYHKHHSLAYVFLFFIQWFLQRTNREHDFSLPNILLLLLWVIFLVMFLVPQHLSFCSPNPQKNCKPHKTQLLQCNDLSQANNTMIIPTKHKAYLKLKLSA